MKLNPIELPDGDGLRVTRKGTTKNGTPFICLHNPSLVGDIIAARTQREANYNQNS